MTPTFIYKLHTFYGKKPKIFEIKKIPSEKIESKFK